MFHLEAFQEDLGQKTQLLLLILGHGGAFYYFHFNVLFSQNPHSSFMAETGGNHIIFSPSMSWTITDPKCGNT